jgi:uncharacterized lipoprotein
MTISTQSAASIVSTRTRSARLIAVSALMLLSAACARFLPADPYKNTQTVKVLEVPEGKQRPAVDPSLAVPEGDSTWTDNGHAPPAVASAETAKPELAPEIIEKTDADE